MSKIIKESGPWGEITNYYYEYLDVISQRDALRLELERLKGTTIKISDEGTGCCISCEAYAKELERVYRKLAANHVLELEAENTRWREIAKKMSDYIAHEQRCVRSEWEAGEPTKNGGYRTKYRGKWYQSKPVDKTPKCECGADEVLSAYAEALKK